MSQPQSIEPTTVAELPDKTRALRDKGFRLVQIGATRLAKEIELIYSFDLNRELTSLRVLVPAVSPRLPSISPIFACAVLYENEIHDLFGVEVQGLALDFHGNFYQTSVKFPFALPKPAPAKPGPAKTAPAEKS